MTYMIDVRRLRILREVARGGSFSAAADSLGYTPSAISQQMATLERETATTLVLRTGKGVHLTDAGRLLLRHTESVLGTLAEAEAELEAINGLRLGRLRIAAFATGAATIVPLAIAEYRRRNPAVELSLVIAEEDDAILGLRDNEFDLAISLIGADYDIGAIERRHLLDDPMVVALPHQHRLARAGRRVLALEDLREEPWMLGTPGTCPDYQTFHDACAAAGFEPKIAFENDDYTAIQGLVAAGVGVALIPDMAAVNVREDVVLCRLGANGPTRRVFALTVPGADQVPAVASMLDALTQVSDAWAARRRHLNAPPTALAS